jgi:penicillin-binding protein 2
LNDYFKDKEPTELKRRIFITAVVVIAAFFILAVRFWYLQVKEATYYRELSQNNSVRLIKATAPRGIVYDSEGLKIAENRPGFDLYVVPEDVKDWPKIKEMLKRLIDLDPSEIDEKLQKAKGRPKFQAIALKEDLSWDETVKIESYKFELQGLMLDVSPKRSYLYGESTAHLMGYLGEISEQELDNLDEGEKYGPGDLIGKYGLEKSYEKDLKGNDGGKEIEVDAMGRKIQVINWSPPYPGNNIKLTIDMRAQMAAWQALKDHAGAAVAMDPQTGRILAMVSTPSFDSNALSTRISAKDWKAIIENPLNVLMNRVLQAQYPPASTFKPIHAAAALQDKVITPATLIYSGPSFRYAGHDYRDWQVKGHGTINVHRAIVESSDTFFYQVGLKIGVDRLSEYVKTFGFGKKTGIGLLNEKAGIVPSSEWKKKMYGIKWYEGETISVSVGQGYMLTTPLQLVNAYAAIANGGTLHQPFVVEEITSPTGKVLKKYEPKETGKVAISEQVLAYIRDALKGVVDEKNGTASSLKSANLKIAGKTGTAQVAKLIKRTKNIQSIAYKYRDHAWFAGFAPYDDPKIVLVVLVEHGGFGASAAAPVAREIFKAYLGDPNPPKAAGSSGKSAVPTDNEGTEDISD